MNVVARVETYSCPCCGGFIGEAAPVTEILETMPDTPRKSALRALVRKVGRPIEREQLIEAMWGDRLDGGPESIDSSFGVQLSRLRKDLKRHGWTILCIGRNTGEHNHGGSYKLIPSEVGQ